MKISLCVMETLSLPELQAVWENLTLGMSANSSLGQFITNSGLLKMDRESSHTILNELSKLQIMHDLLKDQRFDKISKEEIIKDALESLEKIKEAFLSNHQ